MVHPVFVPAYLYNPPRKTIFEKAHTTIDFILILKLSEKKKYLYTEFNLNRLSNKCVCSIWAIRRFVPAYLYHIMILPRKTITKKGHIIMDFIVGDFKPQHAINICRLNCIKTA